MRRILTGLIAFLLLTGTFLVLPVYAEEGPQAQPVVTSSDEVPLGSVEEPAPEVEVQEGTTDPVEGVPAAAPTLSLTRTDTAPFSLVGVTWAFDPQVSDTVVQVRVRDAEGVWGSWTEVTPETADQQAVDTGARLRGGTSPLWTGPGTGVQVELVTRSGAQPTDVALDLIDPGSSPADGALDDPEITDTAHAAATMPAIYSRAQWGADERIRTWDPQYASTIKAATLHHTADSNSYSAADVPAIMRSIYRYHTVSLGWGDIGYNVIADKFGRLWEGRFGGLASTVMGAHAGGFNTATFGVSMLGNYDVVPVPQATVDAVVAVIGWKFSLFGIDARATTTLRSSGGGTSRYAAGTSVTLPTIFAHRDVGSTACPGRYGNARLAEIRDRVADLGTSAIWLVRNRYDSDPAARALLGAQVTAPTLTPDGSGAYAHYAKGSIYASPATGARILRDAVREKWASLGYERSALGYPLTDVTAISGGAGAFAHFQKGSVYWSSATGARVLSGAVLEKWGTTGWENGPLGYPVSDVTSLAGGVQFAHFQGGSVYWSQGTGARVVSGVVRDRWAASGWERGPLGLPVGDVTSLAGGVQFAHFQKGSVYWSQGTGARLVLTPVRDRWAATGWERGPLGLPVSDQVATPGGKGQVVQFQRGWVYWSQATGARLVSGSVRDEWLAAGADGGALGMPLGDVAATADGKAQAGQFQGGWLYVHESLGARVVPVAVRNGWEAAGGVLGSLGYPTSDVVAVAGGRGSVMPFQGGAVFVSAATGGHGVPAALLTAYETAGGPEGLLGFPTAAAGRTPDGKARFQHFQGGSVYVLSSGTFSVPASVRSVWSRTGWEHGPLGYPTGAAVATAAANGGTAGTAQPFEGGTVYVPAGGTGHLVSATVEAAVGAAGGTAALGLPTSDVLRLPDGKGSLQRFERGSVYSSPATGTRAVTAELLPAWGATGWERGPLGYPTTSATALAVGGGRFAHFQGGSVYWSPVTGARVLRGPVREAWAAVGWERSVLGYPTTDVRTTPDGKAQYAHFQGGSVYWTQATGARVLTAELRAAWAATGWERGPLGYPTTSATALPGGGRFAHFQGGSVYWTQATGAHALPAVVRDAWAGTGWERGPLGYPTSGPRAVAGGTITDFQRGWIRVSSTTGRASVTVR